MAYEPSIARYASVFRASTTRAFARGQHGDAQERAGTVPALSTGEPRDERVLKVRRSRSAARLLTWATVVMLLATASGARPAAAEAPTTPFTDIAGTTFAADIEWLYTEGVTRG